MAREAEAQSAGGAPPYRVGEVARQLGVSNKAVLDALKRSRIPGFKLNRMWLIPRDAINRLRGDGSQAA
jgi:excisionase family DNA binding protein